ncbi:alpha/beta hydrolase [Allostella humosa]|uniref:alpha/beta fold hydrolase n=1 Tax=Stella humosa TaxID=94 RepID=UPI001136D7F9|nr:alpha/beta fold hydrolase [Stella humosa]BBK34288.1 alpha/beta hydrolase [Stella humosa]
MRSASPGSNPPFAGPLADLAEPLRAVDPEAFSAALDHELRDRADRFLRGLELYRHHPYRRELPDMPAVWGEGTTTLRQYGRPGAPGPAVLVVPSLVNRAYILDLAPGRSLLHHLAGRGLRPYLVDWAAPGPEERGFDLTAYVAGRLEAALDAVVALEGGPVAVLGYCMGGDLALALACRRPRDVCRLALLATPWDFHAERGGQARAIAAWFSTAEPWIARWGDLPVDLLQMLFMALDPALALRKFSSFADLDPTGDKAHAFVALEDWLNDGVPLAAPVARECLVDWYGANAPARRAWRVAGRVVDPAALRMPTLVMAPQQDRIVPHASATALAAAIPGATLLSPTLGHIGMIAGGGAPAAVWAPLAGWLDSGPGDP